MERLTFYENGKAHFSIGYSDYSGKVADKLAAYEDAEEQGILIRLPCKAGEIVWIAHPKYNRVHRGMFPCVSFIMAEIENGCIICKTREEAEAALAKECDSHDA